jgi:3-oxoacyl-[acyl-carrier protein] reductase
MMATNFQESDETVTVAVFGANSGVYGNIQAELRRRFKVIEFSRMRNRASNEKQGTQAQVSREYYEDEIGIFETIKRYDPQKLVAIDFRGEKRDALIQVKKIVDFREEIEINLIKKYELCALLCRYMARKKWGRVIHFGSTLAKAGAAGNAGYAVSKFGQIGLSKVINSEYNGHGITSNIINIGYMDAGMFLELSERAQYSVISALNHPTNPKRLFNVIEEIIRDGSIKCREIELSE